jgi:NTE family protein
VFDVLTKRNRGDDDGDRAASADAFSKPGMRIGLALGGGAARGWAHIGVLRTLIAAGYEPEVIAGTSIGAVVGGCYAAGKLDTLEDWARSLTRRRVFSLLDISFGGTGLITGNRLRQLLTHDIGDIAIEDLPLRFGAVATEIGSGHEVWLTHGRLSEAVRASYALPGIFEPVRLGGRWLMDGALVNPVPVSTARALGARLVVAVNLQADVYGRGAVVPSHGTNDEDETGITRWQEERQRSRLTASRAIAALRGRLKDRHTGSPPGIPTVMIEAFNITQDRIARSRLAGDPPDIAINPKLGRIGLFEFHRAEEAIALGAEAAEKALDGIQEACVALS